MRENITNSDKPSLVCRSNYDFSDSADNEAKFRGIVDAILDPIILIDSSGVIQHCNPAAEKQFGYSYDYMVGRNVSLLMPSPHREAHDAHVERYISTGHSGIIGTEREVLGLRRDGTTFPIELAVSEMRIGERLFFCGTIKDITKRRLENEQLRTASEELLLANQILEKEVCIRERAEETIATSLREKEVFLKEIHHRVKNNLQLVISIINLHMERIHDEDAAAVLFEIRDRIYAIAHLHELLYQSGDLTVINLEHYINNLTTNLVHSCSEGNEVDVDFEIQPVKLSIDETLRCGLIINELVLNSLKHAFVGRNRGRITIQIKQENKGKPIAIVVADNGIGFPSRISLKHPRTIGFYLIEKLAETLGAKVLLSNRSGAHVKMTFVPEDKRV